MKVFLTCLLLLATYTTIYAQNSNPWPSSGNVGIGTTAPGSLLSLYGNDPAIFRSLTLTNMGTGNGAGNAIYMGYNAHSSDPYGIRLLQSGYPSLTRSSAFAIQRHGITVGNDWINSFAIDFDGNIGLGTTAPQGKMDIYSEVNTSGTPLLSFRSNFHVAGNYGMIRFGDYTQTTDYQKGALIYESVAGSARGRFHIALENTDGTGSVSLADAKLTVLSSGNVGIGTTTPDNKLTVNGTVHSKSIVVDMNIFPDYVFHPDYHLPSLSSVNAFVKKYRHLPEVPPEKEVFEKGMNVGEINLVLIKKVEELTLYMIRSEENRKRQTKEIKRLKKSIIELKHQVIN